MTQRSLRSRATPDTRAHEARDIATRLIAHQGTPHVMHDALEFLQAGASCELTLSGASVSVSLAPQHLPANLMPPSPYGLKGGAAREALTAALSVRPIREPRDLDIIRRGHFPIASDDAIARQYMPRDYTHGARVELVRDLTRYLATRDITINEVSIFDTALSSSLLAALDTVGYVIRPSHYRGGSIHRAPSLDGRTLLKMVRLFAEAEIHNEPAILVGIPEEVSFSEFDLALQLNKAFQRGEAVASVFVETLLLLGALDAAHTPLPKTLQELAHLRHGERGLFPDVPQELFRAE